MIPDLKIAAGTLLSASALTSSWIEQANDIGGLILTGFGIVVACLTAWYTWERADKLRKARKENK